MKNIFLKKIGGFTVLESIVAIAILSLSIVGAFSAVQQSIYQTTISKNEIKAIYLIQEAFEYLRNVRDENGITNFRNTVNFGTSQHWLTGLAEEATDPCYYGNYCMVDVPNDSVDACSPTLGCDFLKEDPLTNLFGYNTGNTTIFKREILFQKVSDYEIAVVVYVRWSDGRSNRVIRAKTHLFNWI